MSDAPAAPVTNPFNGVHTAQAVAMPDFPHLEQLDPQIPPLHFPGARPVVRDRWDRLVTVSDVPFPPERVWEALASPAEVTQWLGVCRGSLTAVNTDCVLDFEDGEFFLCRAVEAQAPHRLRYLWRWLGIGQATSVTWDIRPTPMGSRITVTEEAKNAPWDWQTWNGGGWPGILDQLGTHLRTGANTRWPWRRMGPYVQIELPVSLYEAYDILLAEGGLRFWLQIMNGQFAPGNSVTVMMGDASGAFTLNVQRIVPPGQEPPSFLPYVSYAITRPVWNCEVYGRIWLEPSGWGRSLLQAFHANWENLPPALQLSERRLVANFLAGAARRAQLLCLKPGLNKAPHSWSA